MLLGILIDIALLASLLLQFFFCLPYQHLVSPFSNPSLPPVCRWQFNNYFRKLISPTI